MRTVAVSPDGAAAYALSSGLNRVFVVDTASAAIVDEIPAGFQPQELALAPDGSSALAGNFSTDLVTPMDLEAGLAGEGIPVSDYPTGIAVTPDSAKAYVGSENDDEVTPIDLATGEPGTPIPVGGTSRVVAITPNQPPVARLTVSDAVPGQPVAFDASLSTDAEGSIASYHWDFGDGASTVTDQPTVSHVYASEGEFLARVRLSDEIGCSTTTVFTGRMASCNGSPQAVAARSISLGTEGRCATQPLPPGCEGRGGDGGATPPPGGTARLELRVTPRRAGARPGRAARFTVRTRNAGDGAATGVRLCVSAPRRLVRGAGCRPLGTVAPGGAAKRKIRLRPTSRSRRGARIKLRFRVTAQGQPAGVVRARLAVR